MNPDHPSTLAREFAAARDWWREAGVDCLFADEPAGWIEAPEEASAPKKAVPKASAAEPPHPPLIGRERSAWPATLAEFPAWWLSEPTLDEGGAYPRVPPRGEAGAELMVLVPEPEVDDRETLLSAGQGKLIAGMLSAMGIERAYIASALPRHMPLPDWPRLAASGMGEVLRHHVSLAAPTRLLVLGGGILPLLGHDPAQGSAAIRETRIQDRPVPTLAARGPAYLLTRPDARKALWQRWLGWTAEDGN